MIAKIFRLVAATAVALLLLLDAAEAEERLALVVGNAGYQSVAPLDNAAADARLIAGTLEGLGFRVTLLTDATLAEFGRKIAEFGRDLRAAGPEATGLFYYAGHGVQSFGANYLLPVDAALTDAADLDFVAVEAQSVLRQMASASNRTNIVILDACRNNPFAQIPEFGDNGLAEMKAPRGTFLAYATEPGAVALDGADGNSPFSAALARQMASPGTPIEEVFRNVRVEVLAQTGGRQTPWDTSSLTAEFQFAQAPVADPKAVADERLWAGVRETRDPVQIMLFLRAYPDSAFAGEARGLMLTLLDGPAEAAAPEVRTASPEEEAMIAAAQASGAAADYGAYLAAFPDGVYAELARGEIAAAAEAPAPAAPAPQVAAVAPPAAAAPVAQPEASADVVFTAPLDLGDPALAGKSIADLLQGSPLFPPIEGLPEEIWKGKTCTTCHQWTQEALCTQAGTYVADLSRALDKDHPLGGAFKSALRSWAIGGCR